MNNLHDAIMAVKLVQDARGSKEKMLIIDQNKDDCYFKQLLYYACHPLLSYKVSEATLSHRCVYDPAITLVFTSVFEVCEILSKRKALDDATVYQVMGFLEAQSEEHREFYKKLLSKTLRLGVTAKTINKVIPGLIPEWEVQQAYPVEKYPLKDGAWFAVTEKLNGIRATFYRGELRGRSGNVLSGLDHIVNELDLYSDLVFDGELIIKDKGDLSDNEAFRLTTGIVNSENDDKTRIWFRVFDLLPVYEFDAGKSSATYRERREQLDRFAKEIEKSNYIKVVPALYYGNDQSMVSSWLDWAVSNDKEGVMLNLDVPYQCKRHNGILKVKRFYTMDLPIVRCEPGTGKYKNTLGAIVVDYQGVDVGVGTGFTDEQRDWFWSHQEEVVGMLAEVKYKEISCDKTTGDCSLQFPVFISIRTDKEDISFG